jgi:flagellar biosynthesis protein FlhF
MRLKVYQAPNIGAAMAMVRTELGPDALILATRPAEDGVEITAALEPESHVSAPLPDPHRAAILRWHGVPGELVDALASPDLVASLEGHFAFGQLALHSGAPPLLLFGPPGAGKTLTVARLATRLVLAGQAPLVVSADGQRAGAADQLAAFTRLLGLTLIVADEPLTLARALTRRQDGCPVLIDMPGLDHNAPADRGVARELMAASAGQSALVLPAGLDPAEAGEIGDGFKQLGARTLIATRLDQSRRLGGILAAAKCGLAFAEAGVGPSAADGLCSLTPTFLAERLEAGPRTASAAARLPFDPTQATPPRPPRATAGMQASESGHTRLRPDVMSPKPKVSMGSSSISLPPYLRPRAGQQDRLP